MGARDKGGCSQSSQGGDTPLGPLLTKKLKRSLKPVFETHIHRTRSPFPWFESYQAASASL